MRRAEPRLRPTAGFGSRAFTPRNGSILISIHAEERAAKVAEISAIDSIHGRYFKEVWWTFLPSSGSMADFSSPRARHHPASFPETLESVACPHFQLEKHRNPLPTNRSSSSVGAVGLPGPSSRRASSIGSRTRGAAPRVRELALAERTVRRTAEERRHVEAHDSPEPCRIDGCPDHRVRRGHLHDRRARRRTVPRSMGDDAPRFGR